MRHRLARWRWTRLQRRLALSQLLAAFAESHPQAVFIEIGSNDGELGDHLRRHILARDWTGVMVEPVPYVFERLKANYAGVGRVTLENAAVAASDGELDFFHLRDADREERASLPGWYDGVGSFNRDTILGHASQIPDVAERIVRRAVLAISFETLCQRHGIRRPDLVLIDTEGYDWEIIRSIDLAARGPRLLVYEHFHLSPQDRAACVRHLEGAGYHVKEEGFDTMCLRPLDDPLTALFARLMPTVEGVADYQEGI
jgi:FkbM family methyltransferase